MTQYLNSIQLHQLRQPKLLEFDEHICELVWRKVKYARIEIAPDGQLRLILPLAASVMEARQLLEQKRSWIEKQLVNFNLKDHLVIDLNQLTLAQVDSPYLLFGQSTLPLVKLNHQLAADQLLLNIDTGEYRAGASLYRQLESMSLAQVYLYLARVYLPKRLEQLAEQAQISYAQVTIKNQKKRWGSCSSKGNINLNWRLILVPKYVSDYVMIHELCHRLQMNHSSAYWQLVAEKYPKYQQAEAWLKQNELSLFMHYQY